MHEQAIISATQDSNTPLAYGIDPRGPAIAVPSGNVPASSRTSSHASARSRGSHRSSPIAAGPPAPSPRSHSAISMPVLPVASGDPMIHDVGRVTPMSTLQTLSTSGKGKGTPVVTSQTTMVQHTHTMPCRAHKVTQCQRSC